MNNLYKKSLIAISFALALSGCSTLHSTYERPELAEYTFINGEASKGELNSDIWVNFNDELLNSLVQQALVANNDYYQAIINVKKAMLEADIADTNLIPTLDGKIGSGVSKSLDTGASANKTSSSSLGLSYEIDLFGKLSAERKAAMFSAEESQYNALTARLTLASTVAKVYWQIVYYKDAVRLGEQNLVDSQKTYQIMLDRYNNGNISELEVVQAKRDLIDVETTLFENKTNLTKSITAMNTMLCRVPNSLVETVDSLDKIMVPTVKPGIGSDLLRNRPDVLAAEAAVKSALAQKDVAKLSLYPSFSLTADVSAGKTGDIAKFFENPVGSLAGMLSFPFLNYYQRNLDIDVASLSRDSKEMTFVYTYYNALGEVDDALKSVDLYETKLANDTKKLELNRKSEQIYQSQYMLGKVALKDYLEAQAARRNVELKLFEDKNEQLNNMMTLGKALGGL
jgi:NodT family efflux transporter outer membrane factor (OMF) lipoprotein